MAWISSLVRFRHLGIRSLTMTGVPLPSARVARKSSISSERLVSIPATKIPKSLSKA